MTRQSNHALAKSASRPVPPLPHPSWNRALSGRNQEQGRIEPEEFWERLGL